MPENRLHLNLQADLSVPLEVEGLSPERLARLTLTEIARLPAYLGNEKAQIGDFFRIAGQPADTVVLEGDLARVKGIGAGMGGGRLRVTGSVGMHAGADMTGGELFIEGNAGDWLGAEMAGGTIRVRGNCGDLAGAAYRGSRQGMRGGTLIVQGDAGGEIGARMRRGWILIGGDTGDFTGVDMLAGTILVLGQAGPRPGAWMNRGSLILIGPAELTANFLYDCTYEPSYLNIYLRRAVELGLPVEERLAGAATRCFHRYSGDTSGLGKGEILLWAGATV